MTLADFQCLKANGMDFAVIQTWEGGYQMSPDIGELNNLDHFFLAVLIFILYLNYQRKMFKMHGPLASRMSTCKLIIWVDFLHLFSFLFLCWA